MRRLASMLACGFLCACSLIHDLDPDKLPEGDAADVGDAADTLVELTDVPTDTLVDPESDCTSPAPLAASCPLAGIEECPDPGLEGVMCTPAIEEFGGSELTGSFEYSNGDEPGACASLCQCEGFITLFVPDSDEHYPEYSGLSAPKVRINTSSVTGTFRVETRIVINLDVPGKMAGIYVAQDDYNIFGIALTCDESHDYLSMEGVTSALGPFEQHFTVSGPLDDVQLVLARVGADSWEAELDGTITPVPWSLDLDANEVGLYTGNYMYSGLPSAAALFDYFCIDEDV